MDGSLDVGAVEFPPAVKVRTTRSWYGHPSPVGLHHRGAVPCGRHTNTEIWPAQLLRQLDHEKHRRLCRSYKICKGLQNALGSRALQY